MHYSSSTILQLCHTTSSLLVPRCRKASFLFWPIYVIYVDNVKAKLQMISNSFKSLHPEPSAASCARISRLFIRAMDSIHILLGSQVGFHDAIYRNLSLILEFRRFRLVHIQLVLMEANHLLAQEKITVNLDRTCELDSCSH